VGDTEIINTELINILIKEDYIPVISPIAMDINGKALNINADTVAGDIAAALKAKKLILMTDVPGLLKDINDRSSRISRVAIEDIEELVDSGLISGGMIPKMRSAATSVTSGVEKIHIIDGSVSHSILLELFTDTGIGTMVFKREDE
jgi:acetylglutamate kinase